MNTVNVINIGLFIYCKIRVMFAFSAEDRKAACLSHSCIPRAQRRALHVIGTQSLEMATSTVQTIPILGADWGGLINV